MKTHHHHDFIPAAHWAFLTPLYDPFCNVFYRNALPQIVDIIGPKGGQKILDIGCGTGLLIQALKGYEPKTEIIGIDIDPEILHIASKKFRKNNIDAKLIEASATKIPLHEKFDIVTSTLMIHHLATDQKLAMLKEARRLLKSGGPFYLFDFGPPRNWLGRVEAKITGFFEPISEGIEGKYADYLREAGFKEIRSRFRRNIFELWECR